MTSPFQFAFVNFIKTPWESQIFSISKLIELIQFQSDSFIWDFWGFCFRMHGISSFRRRIAFISEIDNCYTTITVFVVLDWFFSLLMLQTTLESNTSITKKCHSTQRLCLGICVGKTKARNWAVFGVVTNRNFRFPKIKGVYLRPLC